jgi:hypothetical protein
MNTVEVADDDGPHGLHRVKSAAECRLAETAFGESRGLAILSASPSTGTYPK